MRALPTGMDGISKLYIIFSFFITIFITNDIIKPMILLFYFRGLFIIDDKGMLRQITINDLPVGRSIDETLRLVQAFQFTDKHGEGTTMPFDFNILTYYLQIFKIYSISKMWREKSCYLVI